ncbi:MAG: hypothetical protein HFH34_09080 [Eubacterium sp.]|nr:hypothetical protein [Eubacterium sp.]
MGIAIASGPARYPDAPHRRRDRALEGTRADLHIGRAGTDKEKQYGKES